MRLLPAAIVTLALHPLHTTLTQLTYTAADRSVQVSVRAFADDFRAGVVRLLGPGAAATDTVPETAAFAYLKAALTLVDRRGRALTLEWCGVRRTGDLLWLCLRAPVPAGLDGLQVHPRQLFELHEDQINIVQASYDGRKESVLFSRGDPPKRLP